MQCLSRYILVSLSKAKEAVVEIFELLHAFKPLAVLIQALLIAQTGGIENVTNHVTWYLGTFAFGGCCQAVEAVVP